MKAIIFLLWIVAAIAFGSALTIASICAGSNAGWAPIPATSFDLWFEVGRNVFWVSILAVLLAILAGGVASFMRNVSQ